MIPTHNPIERVALYLNGLVKMQIASGLPRDESGSVTMSLAPRFFGVVREVKALPIFSGTRSPTRLDGLAELSVCTVIRSYRRNLIVVMHKTQLGTPMRLPSTTSRNPNTEWFSLRRHAVAYLEHVSGGLDRWCDAASPLCGFLAS
jgi:hypothetical protein